MFQRLGFDSERQFSSATSLQIETKTVSGKHDREQNLESSNLLRRRKSRQTRVCFADRKIQRLGTEERRESSKKPEDEWAKREQ